MTSTQKSFAVVLGLAAVAGAYYIYHKRQVAVESNAAVISPENAKKVIAVVAVQEDVVSSPAQFAPDGPTPVKSPALPIDKLGLSMADENAATA